MPALIRKEQNKILTHRIISTCSIIFGLFLLLAGRLFFLQVLNSQRYKLLSEKNRIYTSFSVAPRGNILDCNHKIIATSQFGYQAILDLHQYRYDSDSWEKIQHQLHLPSNLSFPEWLAEQRKSITPYQTLVLKDSLQWKELVEIEMLSAQIFGIYAAQKFIRFYPYGEEFCHLLGYVTQPKLADIDHDANLKILGATIGEGGVERSFDLSLRGTLGVKQSEINAMRRLVRVLEESPYQQGTPLRLTVNADLQHDIMKIMQPVRSGAVVVLDIASGEILALASCPTFNPNEFSQPMATEQWQKIANNLDHPLMNRAIGGLYAPGSTFKMIVALAALHTGVIQESSTFYCPGYYEINGHRFHCWKWRTGGHGSMNVVTALEQSCDVFFYNLANKLKPNTIIEVARTFGFGSPTGVELTHEKKGFTPPIHLSWRPPPPGLLINLSIGQGQILATPLQLATMTAQIASGKIIKPHLLRHPASDFLEPLPYSLKHLALIRRGMDAVVNGPHGTAQNAQNSEITLAGKTGSTQVCKITKEERMQSHLNDRPYHLRDHALFVGFAPVNAPKFAIAVIVEHGGSGGRVAAPLARDILIAAQKATCSTLSKESE